MCRERKLRQLYPWQCLVRCHVLSHPFIATWFPLGYAMSNNGHSLPGLLTGNLLLTGL